MDCRYVLVLFILVLSSTVQADETSAFEPGPSYIYDQIYTNLGTPSPCVRFLDKDDAFGCTSPQKGSVGSLYPILSSNDLSDFVKSSTFLSWIDQRIIVLHGDLFNKSTIGTLASKSNVAGVLVLTLSDRNGTRPTDLDCFSPAAAYPNKQWGLYPESKRTWNPCENSLSWVFEDQPFPMFALDYSDSHLFLDKALDNKNRGYSWPKWTAELNAFMWASENSETCLRRGHCDPMGGQSVWSGMEDKISSTKGIVLAMAQADSNAFFHDFATGGEAHSSSVAALLTAAQALADWRVKHTAFDSNTNTFTPPEFKKELIFGFWTGEAWGYIGSRKFVWDIQNFECKDLGPTDYCKDPYKFSMAFKNLSLSRIEAIVELDQVGLMDATVPKLFVHREGPQERTDHLMNLMTTVSTSSGVDVVSADVPPNWEIPPSSLHSFLRANRSIPGVVLADYKMQYTNKFYHSRLDDATNAGVSNKYVSVCKAANFVARLLWSLAVATVEPPADLVANCDIATMYMDCLVSNNTCEYKRKLLGLQDGPVTPTHYSGIYRSRLREITLTAKFLYEAMSVITSKQNYLAKNSSFVTPCNTSSQCPKDQNLQCQLGLCRNATTFYHDAVSTGLKWEPDSLGLGTGQWVITNTSEPLYTESRWDNTGIRLFLSDNYLVELTILFAGVVEFCVFLTIFWYIRKYMLKK